MEDRVKAVADHAGWLAAVLFIAAVGGFGAALEGYSQLRFPVALLGAMGFPHALAFNLLAFVVPGMLAGVVAMILRRRLPPGAGWLLRIGAQLVFLSALAFIAMGLLPLDPSDLESDATRWHGTAWMLWTVAFVPGALALGAGLLGHRGRSRFAWLCIGAAAGVLLAGFVFTDFMPAGLAQRIAFGVWFVWLAIAAQHAP
jgi:bacteriorhodopsin